MDIDILILSASKDASGQKYVLSNINLKKQATWILNISKHEDDEAFFFFLQIMFPKNVKSEEPFYQFTPCFAAF